jgi:hypothetical protein
LVRLFEGDLAWEDESIGIEDEGGALDLACDPLCDAEEEVFIDEDAYSVGELVFGLALVPAIAKVNDGVHKI